MLPCHCPACSESELRGEVVVTNTEKLPQVLPQDGVRVVLSQAGPAAEKRVVTADCPLVGSTVVLDPKVQDTPGSVVCSFRAPLPAGWAKGSLQAQLQTMLSAAHDVDSGAPQPFDIAALDTAEVEEHGKCVHVSLARVSSAADVAAANSNEAVASLAQSLGADGFRLLSKAARASSGRMPPSASDVDAEPLTVCESGKVAWQETYGPFGDLDCGAGMVGSSKAARQQLVSLQGSRIACFDCSAVQRLQAVHRLPC